MTAIMKSHAIGVESPAFGASSFSDGAVVSCVVSDVVVSCVVVSWLDAALITNVLSALPSLY